MQLSFRECVLILGSVAVVGGVGALGGIGGTTVAVVASVAASTGILLAGLLNAIRRLERRRLTNLPQAIRRIHDRYFEQTESLLSVLATIRPDRPMPKTRSWAASPDLLRVATKLVLDEQPQRVLETGSGVSTVYLGYVLQQTGGEIIALEQGAAYARQTRDLIQFHDLGDVATVVHAPLRSFDLDGESWLWYDWDGIDDTDPFDLFFVDGPSGDVQPLARYPLLPILGDRLRDGGAIVVDDAHREAEQAMVERWLDEFPTLTHEASIDLEKGASILRRSEPGDRPGERQEAGDA